MIAAKPTGSGHLQLHPAGPRPVDSTLNFTQGRTTSNFETVPVSGDGRVTIFAAAATRVVVRLRGWYATAGTPSGADWPQYRNGPAHPGVNGTEAVLSPTTAAGLGQAWTALATTPVRSAPAVVGRVVYVGGFDGRVRALDAATGNTIWEVAGSASNCVASTAPVVANGVVYHGTASGVLFAREAVTGDVLFTDATTPARSTSPYNSLVVANGAVYAGREAGITAHHP